MTNQISGAEALLKSLIKQNVTTIFGYPGGGIMPIYDALYDYQKKLNHILVRHEQGAIHAAVGFARATGNTGVCFATSGPGATNLVTGIADAMIDSVPIVCITGQVTAETIGTDAFQEADIINITSPITKWNYQITDANEIADVINKAFYIATTGRPGVVLIDIAKSAQFQKIVFDISVKLSMQNRLKRKKLDMDTIIKASDILNNAKDPMMLIGHGVLISKAEKEVIKIMEKLEIPTAVTLHGLSAVPYSHPLYVGLLGMHGNYAPNILTNKADVIFAVGMRFDDRVTSKASMYAPRAKIIHVDIDPAEHNKIIKADIEIVGDAKEVLKEIEKYLEKCKHQKWMNQFKLLKKKESDIENKRNSKQTKKIRMDEVVSLLSSETKGEAVIVADVGQNQMVSAKYYHYKNPNSFITSGGFGTMGFGLPAAIGAKIGQSKKRVIAILGDGGFQMTIQELGTIMQEKLPVKIIILNNNCLGMVRQWQELFFNKRYSFTNLKNPDFISLTKSFGIKAVRVKKRHDLSKTMKLFLQSEEPYLLEVMVEKEWNIFPMIPSGVAVDDVRLE